MQKLVTIYLDGAVYDAGKWGGTAAKDKHGIVEEYLTEELSRGWRLVSVNCFGGTGEHHSIRGWLVVVIEKPDAS